MDEALRKLDRLKDDPPAQARALRMRIQMGDITPFEVKVASFLGHPGAELIFPDALRKGITFKKLSNEDSRLSLLLAWGALRSVLHIWEDDPRTQDLRGRSVVFPEFKRQHAAYHRLSPQIAEVDLHGWPRYILDLIEGSFQTEELLPSDIKYLHELTFMTVQHGRDNMDRYYYRMRPIEDFMHALHDLLQTNPYDTGTGWLKGMWTTKYHSSYNGGRDYPGYLEDRASAVYKATRVLADSEIIPNDIRLPETVPLSYGSLLEFNDSGGVRAITQPKRPKPYVKFKYWQRRHKELAAPYILRYLL